jgi:hypothetical protein
MALRATLGTDTMSTPSIRAPRLTFPTTAAPTMACRVQTATADLHQVGLKTGITGGGSVGRKPTPTDGPLILLTHVDCSLLISQ